MKIDLNVFQDSVAEGVMPTDLSVPLQALWMEARGDWHQAHIVVQSEKGPEAAWVHAYLHRKEGDLSNASYWYRRASRTPAELTFAEEWVSIAETLLRR